jgi:hypothetical protein
MPKRDSHLPEGLSERLHQIIDEELKNASDRLHDRVSFLFRFANMDESEAAIKVLEKHGEPMRLETVARELMNGGIWPEATQSKGSTPEVEVRRSLGRAAKHAAKICFVGETKEIIWIAGMEIPQHWTKPLHRLARVRPSNY